MRVSLFVTCLVDQMWTSIGVSSVEVLRRVGCEVEFDKRQTCCAQPAFNTGYLDEARQVARRFIRSSKRARLTRSSVLRDPARRWSIIIRNCLPAIREWLTRAQTIAAKTHELSSFLVRVLKKEDVGASWNGRLTWHDACHGLRDLNLKTEPRTLIRNVRGAEFVELENADACCGFGGTFSVKYPEISVAILDQKIEAIERAGVQAVVSGDASCLMQIGGRLSRKGSRVRVMHLAELFTTDLRG